MHLTRRLASLSVLLVAGLGSLSAAAQTTGQAPPALVISSTTGRDLFAFYCSSCHGRDGKGDGPVAPVLKTPPPDLTMIAARHGGTFPTTEVESTVSGNGGSLMRSHGTREMPVWGPIFHALDPASETLTRVRIANLVSYIESLQRK